MYRFEVAKTVGVVEEVGHSGGPGIMDPHGVIHELDPIGLTGPDDVVELRHVEGHGLLEEQMLLVLGRKHGPTEVQACGKGHVHRVHIWILQQGLVGPVHLHRQREPVRGGECGGLVDGTACDGAYGGVWGQPDCAGNLPGDVGAAHHSDLDQRFRHFGQRSEEWRQVVTL